MNKPLFLVGGSKGGVGKSMTALTLVDYLRERGEPVLLIETDTSNPDVWRMYARDEAGVIAETVNLDEADGWIELANYCAAHADRVAVVNTAARNNLGVAAHGATLNEALPELGRRLVTLWVINCDRDSLELLEDYLRILPGSVTHVVCNTFFGAPDRFTLYVNVWSKAIMQRGGQSLYFPKVAARVSSDLYTQRWSIARALRPTSPDAPPGAGWPIGHRAELSRWRRVVATMYDTVVPAELSAASPPTGEDIAEGASERPA